MAKTLPRWLFGGNNHFVVLQALGGSLQDGFELACHRFLLGQGTDKVVMQETVAAVAEKACRLLPIELQEVVAFDELGNVEVVERPC